MRRRDIPTISESGPGKTINVKNDLRSFLRLEI